MSSWLLEGCRVLFRDPCDTLLLELLMMEEELSVISFQKFLWLR